jgi:hypothetical protein
MVSFSVRQLSTPHSGSASLPKSPVSFTRFAVMLPTAAAGLCVVMLHAATSGTVPMRAGIGRFGKSKAASALKPKEPGDP